MNQAHWPTRLLTADDYGTIMGVSPCTINGWTSSSKSCSPWDATKRARIASSLARAEALAEEYLNTMAGSLAFGYDVVASFAPVFSLPIGVLPGRTKIIAGTGSFTLPVDATCASQVDITATLDETVMDNDTIIEAWIVPDATIPFPAKIEGIALDDTTLTGTVAAAAIPASVSEWTGTISLAIRRLISVGRVVYASSACPPDCQVQSCEVCLMDGRTGIWTIPVVQSACVCGTPMRYEIDVAFAERRGLAVKDAIVSLANTMLSQDMCSGCGDQMNLRWMRDNGKEIENLDTFSYDNPFGIFLPGAAQAARVLGMGRGGAIRV